jgi:hypothetical protein
VVGEPGLAGDHGGDAAALDAHAQAALVVEQELNLGRARPYRHHAPDHARGADDGRVERDPVRAAAVERHRAVPGHAVGGDHLGEQGVEGQRRLDVGDLAQAVGLAQAVLLALQLHLQRGHAAVEVLVLAVDVAQVDVPRPGGEHGSQSRPDHPLQRREHREHGLTQERGAAALLHLLADDHEMGEHEPAEEETAALGIEDARH